MVFQLDDQLKNDSWLMGHFPLCQIRLINDCQFPWFILVPTIPQRQEIFQLTQAQQSRLWLESNQLSLALMAVFTGDKLNIAAIGNVVSQLHIHHVVRFKTDACWPNPIWGQLPMQHYKRSQIVEISQKLAQHIASADYHSEAND